MNQGERNLKKFKNISKLYNFKQPNIHVNKDSEGEKREKQQKRLKSHG